MKFGTIMIFFLIKWKSTPAPPVAGFGTNAEYRQYSQICCLGICESRLGWDKLGFFLLACECFQVAIIGKSRPHTRHSEGILRSNGSDMGWMTCNLRTQGRKKYKKKRREEKKRLCRPLRFKSVTPSAAPSGNEWMGCRQKNRWETSVRSIAEADYPIICNSDSCVLPLIKNYRQWPPLCEAVANLCQ